MTGGIILGVKFNATVAGLSGNSQHLTFYEGHLRQYSINFQDIINKKGITNIPEALDNKGFRFYCPTDGSEWVNVHFVNGIDPAMDNKPQSGTDSDMIRTKTAAVYLACCNRNIDNIKYYLICPKGG